MFMELPDDLNMWTIDTVIKIVEEHEFEPGIFDYKSVLNATGDEKHKKEHRDSIRRTVCSMANTDGGFILFGILDRKQEVTPSEKRIIGISIQADLRKDFGDKIADILFLLEIILLRRMVAEILRQKSYNMSTLATIYHIDISSYKVLLADISSLLPPSPTLFQELLNVAVYIDNINKFMRGMQEI